MQNSNISSENNSNLKNKVNLSHVQGQENDDNTILKKKNRCSDIDVEEEESVDAKKIEIENIDEEEEEIERNGDEKIEDKADTDADVIEEKGLADLMQSKIQPRMKVFPSF